MTTTPYRPQGCLVSERRHFTLHAMLATHMDIKQQDCPYILPFVQQACNTSYTSTMQENPFFFTLGAKPAYRMIPTNFREKQWEIDKRHSRSPGVPFMIQLQNQGQPN